MAQTPIPKAQLDTTLVDTTSTQTLSGKTLSSPRMQTVLDSSGNTVLDLFPGGNANWIRFQNSATGSPPTFLAKGSDTNINIALQGKGTGIPVIQDSADPTKQLAFNPIGNTTGITGTLNSVFTTAKTLTLPDATDTLVGKATTDTLTNKTFDTAGTGNALKINGTTVSAVTGTGSVVLATSPALTTPNIGAATATTVNGLTLTSSTGTLTIANGSTLVTAGAFSQTHTVTAATNATYPAGTITLQDLSTAQTITGVKTFSTAPVISTITNTGTLTLPTTTDTLIGRATTDTITGAKTFGAAGNVGKLIVAGTTSGTITLAATAVSGSTTATFPAITGTVALSNATVGYITAAQITANFTSTTTTLTAVTGLSVTFTANGVSRYKVTVYSRDVFVSGGGIADVTLWLTAVSTGTQLQGAEPNTPSGSAVPVTLIYYTPTAPAAGSVTYAVGLKGASNTATMEAGATYPAYILVEAF